VTVIRPGYVVALVLVLALGGASLALTAASRARAEPIFGPRAGAPSGGSAIPGASQQRLRPLARAATARPQGAKVASAAAAPARRAPAAPPAEILRVRQGGAVTLRDRPGGRVVARLGDRTDFGSRTTLSVAAWRGQWAAVPSPAVGNGRLGWVDTRAGSLDRLATDARLAVSLSRRRLELRIRGRLVRTVPVAVGRPGSATPTGRFSVTDKLVGSRYGPYYGCCILALSGHQPHPPPGWTGGDRLAIHGTNAPSSIGTPSSAGCLRAAEDDVRVLMRRVPLGTPVVIRG
jgi:lipoprotein-anchoring transpeptidase ErfK/SrfK